MTLQPHQQRVVDEKAQLDDRLAKLTVFLGTEMFANLDDAEMARLLRHPLRTHRCVLTTTKVLAARQPQPTEQPQGAMQ